MMAHKRSSWKLVVGTVWVVLIGGRKVDVDGFKMGKLGSLGLLHGNSRLLLERVT